MNELLPPARRALRARAHHLHPVVAIGVHGVTPAVLHEIDVALLKHELIKVRVASAPRVARDALLSLICKEIECAAVQHLGRIFVLYRENPDVAKEAIAKPPRSGKKTGARKSVQQKTGPRTPPDPIRERRRATRTGSSVSGKGRRGAARHQPSEVETANVAKPGLAARVASEPSVLKPPALRIKNPSEAAAGKDSKSRKPRTESNSQPRAAPAARVRRRR